MTFKDGYIEGLCAFVRDVVCKDDKVIVFERGGKRGKCNHCGANVSADDLDVRQIENVRYRYYHQKDKYNRFQTEQSVICPACGERVQTVLRNGAGTEAYELARVVALDVDDDKTVVARQVLVRRKGDNDYSTIPPELFIDEFYWTFEPDGTIEKAWVDKWGWIGDKGKAYGSSSLTKTAADYWIYLPEGLDLSDTALRYADIPGWIRRRHFKGHSFEGRDNLLRYLIDMVRYPGVEILEKAGYTNLLNQKAAGCDGHYGNKGQINWKATTVNKALRLPSWLVKAYMPQLWTYDTVCRAKLIRKAAKSSGLNQQQLVELLRSHKNVEQALEVLRYASFPKFMEYCKGVDLRSWSDYIDECRVLGYNLKDKDILYPKDLEEAHRKAGSLVKTKKNKDKDRMIGKRAAEYAYMAYSDNGIMIRPALNVSEFIRESDELKHCVGRGDNYINKVINGTSLILWIRHEAEPDKPFYTMEYNPKTGTVIQCRTKNNAPYQSDEEIKSFVTRWQDQLKKAKRAANAAAGN